MSRILVGLLVALAACGGGAKVQTLRLINHSPRPIVELYVYPLGSTARGASRGTLAPTGTLVLRLPMGNLEVFAVSEKIVLDDGIRVKRAASTAIQLSKAPVEVVFHDSDQPPPADRPGAVSVVFRAPAAPTEPVDSNSDFDADLEPDAPPPPP